MQTPELLDSGLVSIDEAAACLGIEPKRLRGFIFRNGIPDPIGDAREVYGWSCKELARRLSVIKPEVQP